METFSLPALYSEHDRVQRQMNHDKHDVFLTYVRVLHIATNLYVWYEYLFISLFRVRSYRPLLMNMTSRTSLRVHFFEDLILISHFRTIHVVVMIVPCHLLKSPVHILHAFGHTWKVPIDFGAGRC